MSGDTPDCEVKKTPPEISAQDYSTIVQRVAEETHLFIMDKTAHLDSKRRWLIVGRILSLIFRSHFGIAYEVASKKLDELSE